MSTLDEKVILAKIYSETLAKLASFSRRVAEGRDINAASEYARWLSFSGILLLLDAHSNSVMSHAPGKIDGPFLRYQCEQLIQACSERYRTNNQDPAIDRIEFISMHEKIDQMAGYLSKLTAASVIHVEPPPGASPDLQLVQGGLPE